MGKPFLIRCDKTEFKPILSLHDTIITTNTPKCCIVCLRQVHSASVTLKIHIGSLDEGIDLNKDPSVIQFLH